MALIQMGMLMSNSGTASSDQLQMLQTMCGGGAVTRREDGGLPGFKMTIPPRRTGNVLNGRAIEAGTRSANSPGEHSDGADSVAALSGGGGSPGAASAGGAGSPGSVADGSIAPGGVGPGAVAGTRPLPPITPVSRVDSAEMTMVPTGEPATIVAAAAAAAAIDALEQEHKETLKAHVLKKPAAADKPPAGKPKPPAGKQTPPAGKPPAGKQPAGKQPAGKHTPPAGKQPAGKRKPPAGKHKSPAGKPPAGKSSNSKDHCTLDYVGCSRACHIYI